jgi:hypothetical protein
VSRAMVAQGFVPSAPDAPPAASEVEGSHA